MRQYLRWGVLLFEVVLIYSLVQGIRSSREAGTRVDKLEEQKNQLLQERAELSERLEYVESGEYLEQVAREELNLAKPGETVVIVPQELVQDKEEAGEVPVELEIWEKWKKVILGE